MVAQQTLDLLVGVRIPPGEFYFAFMREPVLQFALVFRQDVAEAPSSIGQDKRFSIFKEGFDSPRG